MVRSRTWGPGASVAQVSSVNTLRQSSHNVKSTNRFVGVGKSCGHSQASRSPATGSSPRSSRRCATSRRGCAVGKTEARIRTIRMKIKSRQTHSGGRHQRDRLTYQSDWRQRFPSNADDVRATMLIYPPETEFQLGVFGHHGGVQGGHQIDVDHSRMPGTGSSFSTAASMCTRSKRAGRR